MARAILRFYAELNDFLPPHRRQQDFSVSFNPPVTVKHLVESQGAAHPEIELILVNGESVDFNRLVQDGDRISVYPVFEGLDVSPVMRLRPAALRQPRFVLDVHLGRLAAYLRLLGFDSLYRNDYDDAELARISNDEKRALLTRDRGLLKRSLVTHGYCVRADKPREQLLEVLRRFDLRAAVRPFQRCLRCNGALAPVTKEAVLPRLQADTRQYYSEFYQCAACGQVYWKGSHYQRMQRLVDEILDGLKND